MAGKSKVRATQEDRDALRALSCSSDRGEADRSRAMLLTLEGWTSCRIAKAFGVREDTVRQWRSDFMKGGIDAVEDTQGFGTGADKNTNGFACGRAAVRGRGCGPSQLDIVPAGS